MQPKRPTQFRSPVAQDFGVSEMPASSPAEQRFGPGYVIGFLTGFASVAASFLTLFLAHKEVTQIRAFGCVLISFGGTFTFVVIYTIVTRKGIQWTAAGFGKLQSGVLDRRQNAIGFWALCIFILMISLLLVGGGIWVCVNGASLESKLQQHIVR